MSKIVIIDGHSILHRAFFGVPDLTNSQGVHTNAVYGFLNIMFKILDEEKPDYLTVAFDMHAPTFRHKMFDAYKGTRKPMPEELRCQVPMMKELLQAMGIEVVTQEGLEADDLMGTIAKKSEAMGMEVSLVSGDRDLLQIASEHIKIRIPKTKGGKTEIEDYYAKDVLEAYQVTPLQFIELKALMGDTADNIPGVPKVGEKTATELMVTYGSIENIYAHVEEISKKSIRESLKENRELADLSKVLATIKIDAQFPFSYEQAKFTNPYTPEAYALFKQYELRSYLAKFETKQEPAREISYTKVSDETMLEKLMDECKSREFVSYRLFDPYGACVCTSSEKLYFVEGALAVKALNLLQQSGCMLAGMDIKSDYAYFSTIQELDSVQAVGGFFDCKIAAYLLNPLNSNYTIASIANEYLGESILEWSEAFGKLELGIAYTTRAEDVILFFAKEAWALYESKDKLEKKLQDVSMDKLFFELEMPLSFVLYQMEKEGILVKPEELKQYGNDLTGRIEELERSIHEQAGCDFNINSPKQLGEVLFEKLQLPGGKKTKTGYSTAADVLEKMAVEYPVVKDILEYRGLTKLKSTYAEGLAAYIAPDSRIHTRFNQTITATGRLSSTEPNLQNIPMRMELGRRIRKVFIPKPGCVFLDADYSQIELRVLAHMSGDEQLIEAYKMSEDIHRITASKVFHTPLEEVTDLQRRNAKAVNFGIVYGISSFGLSQDLSISTKEAKVYIEEYFKTYPGIKAFLDRIVEDAKRTGYSVSMFGRRRPVPELTSSNFMQRSFGERIAMNSPIQGTAADIIKIAMLHVYDACKKEGLKSRLILQIHDELLLEVYEDEIERVQEILAYEMKHACDMAVSLEIDMHTGKDWYEAK